MRAVGLAYDRKNAVPRLRDGAQCAWLGVASAFQRASQNRFVYSIERRAPGGELTTRVVLLVTFKDP